MQKITDKEECFVKASFQHWDERISDLQKMTNQKNLKQGRSAVLLLACCYMEALGKLKYYNEKRECPHTKEIFIKTLQQFDIEEKNVDKIYKHFRCDFVHSGKTSRFGSITFVVGVVLMKIFVKVNVINRV